MKKILICDDSMEISTELRKRLEEKQYSVKYIDDGQLAVEAVKSFEPDLILMDIVMPGMNGFEAMRELKSLDIMENTPIFIISSKAANTDIMWGKRQGAEEYYTKPLDYEALIGDIEQRLN